MSAALVESVRVALTVREAANAVLASHAFGGLSYADAADKAAGELDLPAILAALTEAESLRAQVVQGQAREVALREALAKLRDEESSECGNELGEDYVQCNRYGCNGQAWGSADSDAKDDIEHSDNCVFSALSAPTDTAALRKMLRAAWIDGIDGDDGSNSADAYIDRVLGGS